MPSRSINRFFGQTSLETKCLASFGAFLLLVITLSFLAYWMVTETVVAKQNPITGKLLAEQIMLARHWDILMEKEKTANEDFLVLVREFTQKLEKQGYKYRCIRPHSQKEQEKPRPGFETELLETFLRVRPEDLKGKQEAPGEVYKDGGAEYQYYQPVRAERSCVAFCHSAVPSGIDVAGTGAGFGTGGAVSVVPLREGDLIGVVVITMPNRETQAEINWYWNMLLVVAIITAFLAMVAFYVTIRYIIVRPLTHLRDVSDAISHGNIASRAEIRTGDEFEGLGAAFNRMLRHLVTIQDELRQVNANLDSKVDQLARANMQLYEMNRIKSDFLATMSHELRTPLNSILGFSDVLGSIAALDDKQKRYVTNIQKSGRMLLEMINNILDLAKIESGKTEIRLTDFSIEQVIRAQCDMARPLTEKKNIDLDAQIEPELPPMYQDQARVQQILNNLLSNAIKFTPEGGRIKVTAQRNARDWLVMRVVDTGVGIAEEDQQAIFEKFRQGRTAMPGGDAMTREYSGTGLGLSIVKELCKLLDGEVTLESELGTGSTFTVELPWRVQKQPRLDSPMIEGFEQFGKLRLDLGRDYQPASSEPPAGSGTGGSRP
jgi:two-component system, NarL family, sensor histidine kinase BarA